MNLRTDTAELARGRWRDILAILGAPKETTSTKHGPCPWCGGRDRYRFDDKEGRGSWICNQCGSGDGFHLLMRLHGWDFREACRQVESAVGAGAQARPAPKPMTAEARRSACQKLWKSAHPVEAGGVADRYLSGRGLRQDRYPRSLRFLPSARVKGGGEFPCLLALVMGESGATLHRTYLAPDGDGKAEIDAPRKLMPGEVPEGAAVRLADPVDGVLGVAEGIETAMSASALFGVPCWALINTTLMAKWKAPEEVSRVIVFGDNDALFGGHAAAYSLAHRLMVAGTQAEVRVPEEEGMDWNDVLMARAGTLRRRG